MVVAAEGEKRADYSTHSQPLGPLQVQTEPTPTLSESELVNPLVIQTPMKKNPLSPSPEEDGTHIDSTLSPSFWSSFPFPHLFPSTSPPSIPSPRAFGIPVTLS